MASNKQPPARESEGCHDQSFFQIHDFEKACQGPVWRKESLGNGERFGEEGEEDPLIAAQDCEASEQQRMSVVLCPVRKPGMATR
jgi:hypothetical protein